MVVVVGFRRCLSGWVVDVIQIPGPQSRPADNVFINFPHMNSVQIGKTISGLLIELPILVKSGIFRAFGGRDGFENKRTRSGRRLRRRRFPARRDDGTVADGQGAQKWPKSLLQPDLKVILVNKKD